MVRHSVDGSGRAVHSMPKNVTLNMVCKSPGSSRASWLAQGSETAKLFHFPLVFALPSFFHGFDTFAAPYMMVPEFIGKVFGPKLSFADIFN
jgi:hypothetical protein